MKLVVATKNPGKLAEIRGILSGWEIVAGDRLPHVDETEETYEGNALLKARSARDATGMLALADDSGLEVTALGGRPGVRSARYGDAGLDDAGRRKRLLAELEGASDRRARFVAAIALAWPGGREETVRGVCEGTILREERGSGGFGYDAIFRPDGFDRTFGELDEATKNRISHRARALEAIAVILGK